MSLNFSAFLLAFMTILLNTCLAIDLILMIKHPFKVKGKRVPFYLWASISIALALTASIFMTVYRNTRLGYLVAGRIPMVCTLSLFACYFFVSIASVLYAVKKVCRPGISKET